MSKKQFTFVRMAGRLSTRITNTNGHVVFRFSIDAITAKQMNRLTQHHQYSSWVFFVQLINRTMALINVCRLKVIG